MIPRRRGLRNRLISHLPSPQMLRILVASPLVVRWASFGVKSRLKGTGELPLPREPKRCVPIVFLSSLPWVRAPKAPCSLFFLGSCCHVRHI
ncbi:hypothetical protein MUK42_34723 [Musa troglodytarum]|uniref:Uncharacterized protein n=1 Tax=Musa troglodytarum TaxID=320322 RepID=A0A9E7JAV1_9LILI|nr:hypothetical protein MUK42_34723 [Musa troglodytarum]